MLVGDITKLRERIDVSGRGRASGRNDTEGHMAVSLGPFNRLRQCAWLQSRVRVCLDSDDGPGPEPEYHRGFLERGVCHLGCKQYRLAIQSGESTPVNVERVVPGDRQGVKVRKGAAAGENPASTGDISTLSILLLTADATRSPSTDTVVGIVSI